MESNLYDFTIVGGGPTGLYGAFYAGLRGMRTKIVDSLPQLGGQLAALYPEKYIYDVGGFPKVLAKDLVTQCAEQALQYDPTVCLDEKVVGLEASGEHWALTTDRGTHLTKTVLIAAGVGAFLPRKLDLPGMDALEGKGIHYFVGETSRLAGRRLVIVGGGDSALDWTLNLHEIAAHITLIHRRDEFRAAPDSVEKMRALVAAGKIDLLFGQVSGLHGEHGQLTSITVTPTSLSPNSRTAPHEIPCNAILPFFGLTMKLGPVAELRPQPS